MKSYLLLLLLLSITLLNFSSSSLLVNTTYGSVLGHFNEVGIREFKGIPYAKPPVGQLRWEYPVEPEYNSDVYIANYNAAGCPQTCKLPPGNCPDYGTSEDCLYLTVFSPTQPSKSQDGYPIHGGAFEQGLGNCALYNGSTFAQKDVVSVVINYRLGVLGYMASPSMQGNYGILDQRLALKWTKANIKGFGGNPDDVTIAGQSAGAMSVGSHMISPNSKGLFQKAIMESNPLALPYHTRDSATNNAKAVFNYLGCDADDVACMRTKSPDQILDAQDNAVKLDVKDLFLNFLPFAPLVEPGGELPDQPLVALAKGEFVQVPVLSGTMYDEGQLFVYELFTKPLGEKEYNLLVEGLFGLKSSKRILNKYPFYLVPNNTDGRNVLNVLATDLLFYCPLRNITTGYTKIFSNNNNNIATYNYRFKHVLSFDAWGPNYTFCVGVVCHGSELPFVFNVFSAGDSVSYTPTADELTLTTDLSNAWNNFIKNGNPNKGLSIPTKYPEYIIKTDPLVVLDEPGSEDVSHVRELYCDMWDSIGYFH